MYFSTSERVMLCVMNYFREHYLSFSSFMRIYRNLILDKVIFMLDCEKIVENDQ